MSDKAWGSKRQARVMAGLVAQRPKRTAMREVERGRAPVSPTLTDTAQTVLGATCFLRSAPTTDIALVTDLSVHVVRRALADLRELRLVTMDWLAGRNVWSTVPVSRECARVGCTELVVEYGASPAPWGTEHCGPLHALADEADAA